MKKLLVAVAVAGLVGTANAQSAFEGFYGQIATGYESNGASNLNLAGTQRGVAGTDTWSTSSQNFGGAPLIIGAGYNFSVAPKWLLGIGIDYSALSQTSSTYSSTYVGRTDAGGTGTFSGTTLKASNRFNIFITPGYEIDKDKLLYAKAGYSSLSLTQNGPNMYTDSADSSQNGNPRFGSQSKTVSGYIVGVGYKQMITKGLYGFAEGNYMSYGKASFSSTNPDGYTISNNPSVNSYQLLVGVGYRF